MGMVLNLKDRKKKTFELTLLDGSTVNLKKPNEDLIVEMEEFEKGLRNVKSVKEVFEGVKGMTLKILNRNAEKKVFDMFFFDEKDEDGELLYDYTVCMAIFSEYSKFTQEVMRNPN